jgi:hypothetical protein
LGKGLFLVKEMTGREKEEFSVNSSLMSSFIARFQLYQTFAKKVSNK